MLPGCLGNTDCPLRIFLNITQEMGMTFESYEKECEVKSSNNGRTRSDLLNNVMRYEFLILYVISHGFLLLILCHCCKLGKVTRIPRLKHRSSELWSDNRAATRQIRDLTSLL